jgi:hypothetical protein
LLTLLLDLGIFAAFLVASSLSQGARQRMQMQRVRQAVGLCCRLISSGGRHTHMPVGAHTGSRWAGRAAAAALLCI